MHTDATLTILDNETTILGSQLREFKSSVCTQYKTRELTREMKARERREANARGHSRDQKPGSCETPRRRLKLFNLQTYKLHALGDYVSMIRQHGTCDSYTTAIVSSSIIGAIKSVL